VSDPEEHFGPARPDRVARLRRAGTAMLAQLRALLFPDRGVPVLVSAGRARLSIAIAMAAAVLSAAAVSARIDMVPTVRAENAGGPGPGGPGGGPPGASAQPPGEDKTDRDIQEEIDKQTAIVRIKAWLRAGLGMPAQIFFPAIALLLLGRYVGGKPTFQRAAAAAAVANLPWAVRGFIEAGVVWSRDRIGPEELNRLLPAELLPMPHDHLLLAPLVAASDLFNLWSLVLAGFGLAAAAGISRARSFIAVTVAYLLFMSLVVSFFNSSR